MIGPTGVGKTEIARRLARLADAPFIKVEATKFTEVGYVGRDVDTIMRDLVEIAIKQTRESGDAQGARPRPQTRAEERVLDVLLPPAREVNFERHAADATRPRARNSARCCAKASSTTRRSRSRSRRTQPQMEIMAPPGMEELTQQIQGMFQNLGGGGARARKLHGPRGDEAAHRRGGREARQRRRDLKAKALANVEQNGIVFLDEIDKIASRAETARRRRLAPGRAARPAAARRGHDGLDQVRHGQDRPHPVHRERRVPPVEAVRPHPRAAGPLPDPRRARSLSVADFEQILTATDACLVAPVRGAARDREREARLHARRRSGGSPRSRSR